MNTANFNLLDKFIAQYRFLIAKDYICKGDVVLDIGCGVQHYLLNYGKNKFQSGYGLDYDVRDSQDGNIRLFNYRYQGKLPLLESFFDKVFMLAVLEHIEVNAVCGLFSELARVLRPNGKIIITTPTPRAKAILEFLAFKLKVVTVEEVIDHKHYYVANEILDLAKASGLKVIKASKFQLGLNSLYVITK
jgi:SAM-dependent methyltransferase